MTQELYFSGYINFKKPFNKKFKKILAPFFNMPEVNQVPSSKVPYPSFSIKNINKITNNENLMKTDLYSAVGNA